jgi:hypothetical protein
MEVRSLVQVKAFLLKPQGTNLWKMILVKVETEPDLVAL